MKRHDAEAASLKLAETVEGHAGRQGCVSRGADPLRGRQAHAPRRQRGPGLYRRSGSRHARGVAEAEEEALASRDRAVNGARSDLTAQAFQSVLTSKK